MHASPIQFLKPGGDTAVGLQWGGKKPEDNGYDYAGKVKDFRSWAIACHSQGQSTLATDDYGDVDVGEWIVKHYHLGDDVATADPVSVTIETQETIETWIRSVTEPDGWSDLSTLEALGGPEEDDVTPREGD